MHFIHNMDLDMLNVNNNQSTTSITIDTTVTTGSNSIVIRKHGRLSRHEQKKRKRNCCNFTTTTNNNNTNDSYSTNVVTIVNQNEERIEDDDDKNNNNSNSNNNSSNRRRISTDITNNYSNIKKENVVLYQDMFNKYYNDDLSIAFFELANASKIAYDIGSTVLSTTLDNKDNNDNNNNNNNERNKNDNIQVQQQKQKQEQHLLIFQQDLQTNGMHTGGIVWETSYLLVEYLLLQYDTIGHVLELGSGSCGLLGQCLAGGLLLKQQYKQKQQQHLKKTNSISISTSNVKKLPFQSIVLTDMKAVINNLQNNVQSNLPILQKLMNGNNKNTDSNNDTINDKIQVCEFDWTTIKQCVQKSNGILQQGKYDIIVGTDILFAPSLVVPLVQTINWLLCDNNTNKTIVYICIHQRCIDTLQLFYKYSSTTTYNLHIDDISQSIYKQYPTLLWGKTLDCILLRITRNIVIDEENATNKKNIKTVKRKTTKMNSNN